MSTAEPLREDWSARMRRLGHAHSIGIAGVFLSVLGFWLALPPWTVPAATVPTSFGVLGAIAGVWAVSRGERRVGWWAIGLAIVCTGGALWAVGRKADALEAVFGTSLLAAALRGAAPR